MQTICATPECRNFGRTPWFLGFALGLVLLLGGAAPSHAGNPFTPFGTQPGTLTHPILSGYNDCRGCHGEYSPPEVDVEPFDMWSGSMMANAGRDPVFWAAVDVANNDIPGVGEYCLRCHAPKAWLEGRTNAGPGTIGDADGCALLGHIDESQDNDFEGVTCHLCHRMYVLDPGDVPPGELDHYTENAQFWIDDEECPGEFILEEGDEREDGVNEPCRRGPYDYVPPDVAPPHEWVYSEYHTESRLCGTCHNVTSPANTLIDENGDDTGIPFPIERTYDEWTQSDYSIAMGPSEESCQECHMPQVDEDNAFACIFEQNDHAGDMAGHDFVGGNTWVPGLLRDQYGSTIDNDDAFDDTIFRAGQLLENAATLALTAPPEVGPGGTLNLDVRVTNLGGHKLPTGYSEGRRMWIHVEIEDGDTNIIEQSGAYDEVTGVLTLDSQAKVYESRRGIWNRLGNNTCDIVNGSGIEEFHFVLDNCIALDNRIPPLGFTGGADPETQPVGYEYPETSPGSGVLVNYDDTAYSFDIPVDAVTPLTIRATLRYQTSSKEYVEFLRDEAVTEAFPDDCITRTGTWNWPSELDPGERSRGEFLFSLWNNGNKSLPHDMVTDTAIVAVDSHIFEDGFESGDLNGWSNSTGN